MSITYLLTIDPPVKSLHFIFRDDGIIFAVTFWQWIAELVISGIMVFLHINRGKNQALDHFILLFLGFLAYVFFPAFYLMADSKFRRTLEAKGLKKAIISALTQKYE